MGVGPGKLWSLLAMAGLLVSSARGQQIQRLDRERAETMLENVSSDVRKYYYDAKLHGLDWDALVRETKLNIAKAPDAAVADAEIAALVERLNDSHTIFIPPRNVNTVDYGWQFKVVGNHCFVTEVSPKSDADNKGMRPGDELLTINGFIVDRVSAPKLKYAMSVLLPRTRLQVELRDPAGKLLQLTVDASIKKHSTVAGLGGSSWYSNQQIIDREEAWLKARAQYKELGTELMIIRIPEFLQTGSDVDNLFKKAQAHKTLIVDLRGTPGGRVDSVQSYLGGVFSHDLKVGDFVQRSKTSPIAVKSNRKDAFNGDLIVLVDSETASGGELFARAVQLEERGTILGDHTSGQTMESQLFAHSTGVNPVYTYGDSVTVADAVMSDGKSLEHIGVEPDRIFLPTAADIAAGRDPVLAFAATLAGVTLSPEDAAKLFPSGSSNE
jgi:C-terminal processing protease CtpA/Prc